MEAVDCRLAKPAGNLQLLSSPRAGSLPDAGSFLSAGVSEQLPEHVLQDASVPVVADLLWRIEAYADAEFDARAVVA